MQQCSIHDATGKGTQSNRHIADPPSWLDLFPGEVDHEAGCPDGIVFEAF